MCSRKIVPIDTGEKKVESNAQRLTEQNMPCDFVLLSISNTTGDGSDTHISKDADNGYFESNEEIYWGFNNKPFHQLFPATQMVFMIPVKDAGDIFVRCNRNKGGGIRKVAFSTFKYED